MPSPPAGKQIPEWVGKLSNKVVVLENASPESCIYKVPNKLRVAGAEKFEPRVISIGPYHVTMENPIVTEHIKELSVQSLLTRITASNTSTPQGTTTKQTVLVKMWEDISGQDADLRACYLPKPDLNGEDFVKMLIYDGCFILDLLYKHQSDRLEETDILFQNNWMIPCLHLDLILLENQIPYSVLTYLFELVPKITKRTPIPQPGTSQQAPKTYSLKELILDFFDPIIPTTDSSTTDGHCSQSVGRDINSSNTDRHLLDLLRTHLIHQDEPQRGLFQGGKQTWEYTTCAIDLRNAGVTFKKKKKTKGLLDITFSNGTLEMPPFHFGKSWAILFPNLIALEQCRRDYPDKITSYAILMDNLISSSDDVKLLRDKGIIDSWKEEDETIAQIVNNLCKEAVFETFDYDGLCSSLNAHRNKRQNQWRAQFVQNYIHTPWAGISLAGASFLLLLSVVQTVFGILSWILALHATYEKNNK